MTSLVFSLRVPPTQVEATRLELHELSDDLRATLPEVALVLVTSRLGLTLLTAELEVIDLSPLSFPLYDRIVRFFGFGCWVLPGTGYPVTLAHGISTK